jgi:uncharacterized damage-inducible protein DinB
MRELIVSYYAYQHWANQRILETAGAVPFEQLTVPVLSGFDPVRSTLAHMMWAQQLWLHRFMGLARVPDISPEDLPDLAVLRVRWDAIDAETDEFLATLTDEQLAAGLPTGGAASTASDMPLWRAMLHQANHQTYHRGEVAAVLTHLGASPGELDFNRMYDGRR